MALAAVSGVFFEIVNRIWRMEMSALAARVTTRAAGWDGPSENVCEVG